MERGWREDVLYCWKVPHNVFVGPVHNVTRKQGYFEHIFLHCHWCQSTDDLICLMWHRKHPIHWFPLKSIVLGLAFSLQIMPSCIHSSSLCQANVLIKMGKQQCFAELLIYREVFLEKNKGVVELLCKETEAKLRPLPSHCFPQSFHFCVVFWTLSELYYGPAVV